MFLRSTLCSFLLFIHVGISLAYEYTPAEAISGRMHDDIQPRDVYARSVWLEREILLIDVEKKLTKNNIIPAYKVSNAKPYEVNFIARSVLNKAQRLSFSYTRELGGHTPKSKLFRDKPINVFRLVNQAMISIQFVKQANKIESPVKEEKVDSAMPSDVYNKLLINSRMISNLNTNKIEPSDVLATLEKAYEIAVPLRRLLLKKGVQVNTETVEKNQASDKTPQDVFYNLVSLFELLSRHANENFSTEILQLEPIKIDREIEPSDVIDLANLILAELTYLANSNSLIVQHNAEFEYNRKERITPSTVFMCIDEIYSLLNFKKAE